MGIKVYTRILPDKPEHMVPQPKMPFSCPRLLCQEHPALRVVPTICRHMLSCKTMLKQMYGIAH